MKRPKIICLCGKIGAGKTTYGKRLASEINAVYLGSDEIMLRLFGGQVDREEFDKVYDVVTGYLKQKAIEILNTGTSVVMERGAWAKKTRDEAREFFRDYNYELHYIDVTDEKWKFQKDKRNMETREGKVLSYVINEELFEKCRLQFETPTPDEIDVHVLDGKIKKIPLLHN